MSSRPLLFSVAMLALVSCEGRERVAGNGGEVGNGIAAGRVVHPDGRPAAGAWVECIPLDHAPWDARSGGWTTRTDSSGRFACEELPLEGVGVSVYDPAGGLGHWHADTAREDGRASVVVDTLAPSGSLRVALPPGDSGTLFLAGLSRLVAIRGEGDVLIAGVPAGWAGNIRFAAAAKEISTYAAAGPIVPGAIDSVGYTHGSTTLRLELPGKLSAAVRNLPLLVRLDSSWSGFGATLGDGTDLRVTTSSGKRIPMTLAFWDRHARAGAFWVLMDSIPAPGDSLDLVLEYGLPVRLPASEPVFRDSSEWEAVWPLGDTGQTIRERTGRRAGIGKNLTAGEGIAGRSSSFDGSTSKVVIPGTSSQGLLPEGGPYTMTCWAKLRMFTYSRYVMGYGDRGSALRYSGNTSEARNVWFAQEFRASPAGKFFASGPAAESVWTHLAVAVEGDSVRLYLDGIRQTAPQAFDRSDSSKGRANFALGVSLDSAGTGNYFFPGDLSEAWIHNVARSPDWIRFAAANQSPKAPVARLVR